MSPLKRMPSDSRNPTRAGLAHSCRIVGIVPDSSPPVLLPVLARGQAHPLVEEGGEVALVGKAQLLAHLRHPLPGVCQQLFGALDALAQQILMRAQSSALLEQPTEEGRLRPTAAPECTMVIVPCWLTSTPSKP
jgi:hypothetical protein